VDLGVPGTITLDIVDEAEVLEATSASAASFADLEEHQCQGSVSPIVYSLFALASHF
jgi:hypothetical protein